MLVFPQNGGGSKAGCDELNKRGQLMAYIRDDTLI